MLSLQFVPRGFAAREPFHPFNGRSEFALRDPSLRSGSRRLPRRLAPARRKTGAASYRTAGRLIGRCCASNLQNGHAISRILTTPTYRIDLSIPKYHPGAHRAPQRNPISIFPSPSSPPYHPITLTPSPGAEPWSAPGRVNICFIFWREHCRFPHILRRNRWRTLEQDSRLGDPFQGAVTGFGSRLEHQPMDIKRGPWSISKTLEKYYVIPPACASGLVRQAVRFSVNRHIVGPGKA